MKDNYCTQWTAEGSVFGAISLWFFVSVRSISRTAERTCAKFTRKMCLALARTSLKVKVKGQRSRSPGTKNYIFGPSVACVQFMFGKTSLASSFCMKYLWNHWMYLHQIHTEDMFGHSFEWVSKSRFCKGHRDKKRIFRPFQQSACGLCLVKHL